MVTSYREIIFIIDGSVSMKTIRSDVVVALLTDAQENASTEFDYASLAQLIEKWRTQDNWEFVFLYADQSAIEICSRMTINVASRAR